MKAFVFDLDGVVCLGPSFTVRLERDHGIPQARWRPFFAGRFRDCIVGRADLRTELISLIPAIGWVGDVDELLRFWFTTESALCDEALRCVDTLRSHGHAVYLGTNQERYRTEYVALEMGMNQRFDGICSSSVLGHAKPSSEYFEAVKERIGISNLLLVDDSIENVRGAQRCGWNAIHYGGTSDLALVMEASDAKR